MSNLPYTIPYNSDYDNFMTFVAIYGSLTNIAQIITILKNKQSGDVSTFAWFNFAITNIFWIIYGLMLNSVPLFVSGVIGFICDLIVVILCMFIYPAHKHITCRRCARIV